MQVETEILNTVIGCEDYHQPACEYGSRAWKAKGKDIDIIYWDVGNGWCEIIAVIPHGRKNEREIVKFYKALRKEISRCYDIKGFRRA